MTQEKTLRRPPRHERYRRTAGSRQTRTTTPETSPYSFPQDLNDAQGELDQIHSTLTELCSKLPWSANSRDIQEPHESTWRPPPRLPSEGWDSDEAAEIARLRARSAELVGKIVAHPFWQVLDPADMPAAWDGLQQHPHPVDGRTS
ncbi:hypothetical protein ABIE67_000075 [Streptomyces sp. V4I8]